MSEYHVIIPSAGSGSRMQSTAPKQYLSLHGKPVLRHVIDTFEACPLISSVTIVIAPHDGYWQAGLLAGTSKTRVVACGGATRAESVLNGLLQLAAADNDWVLVHDAARPGIDAEMLLRLVNATDEQAVGAILALPVADTLKRAKGENIIHETIPRTDLWQAQTPQMFGYAALKQALARFLHQHPTDEAQVMEWSGVSPKLILGDLKNLKITYPQDLTIVAALMQAAEQHRDER